MTEALCSAELITLEGHTRAVRLRNPHVDVLVLPDKGADIYALIDRGSGIDVLWKNPAGLRPPNSGRFSPDSATAWLEQYEGGWQEILPNGGDPCVYKGVELSFHGESTLMPWRFETTQEDDSAVEVMFSAQLYRSPLRVERRMRLTADRAVLTLSETVLNQAGEPIDFMWGHHPAYGAPFLSEHARLLTNAQTLQADNDFDPPANLLRPGHKNAWPHAAGKNGDVDMRVIPPQSTPRGTLGYLSDFDGSPWYAITNSALNLGVGLTWTPSVFRYLWLWQEMYCSNGFPFYNRSYTMAVEPWSSIPGHGLKRVMDETQTQLTLAPVTQLACELSVTLFTTDGRHTVERIEPDGTVVQKETSSSGVGSTAIDPI